MTSNGRKARVTSTDVAREAGVSRSTVSYVLNDTPHQVIPDATRQRVLEAAALLAYAPSAAARALRSGRSNLVLCLLPDLPVGDTLGRYLKDLSIAFAGHDLTFLVHPRMHGTQSIADVWKAISPAAVVSLEEITDEDAATMRAAGIEVAVLSWSTARLRSRELTMPEAPIGRLQAEYLASSHRRIGYALPDDDRLRLVAEARLAGVREVCAGRGVPEPLVRTVPMDADAAAEAIRSWRSATPPVTGVCAYNDDTALAILAGLSVLGLRAPQDLAVIGADDIPAAALTVPPLTTVATDLSSEARKVADAVARALAGESVPRVLEPTTAEIVVRESA
ncbi:LacI family DNA-binding transcriptional regulator [Rhodococcus sp. JVH1]|uniref:LacI family DNA-binding transcriptional regulator n=1 Tax=Rhodococcus sp. JVH1 TaxID=745408 RepID=UPI0002721831|nr:LacI family DNA-binding transcriptional regulator [Rhodococcus sp. JVH1]EJI95802.1 transcriptional regulator, LacI family [Rhodococcus sp. JVH1]